MTSEFSTQRTNAKEMSERRRLGHLKVCSGSASTGKKEKETLTEQRPVEEELAVQILNSEPVRHFHLPESSSENCTPARPTADHEEQENL